jgi:hypothetical protein
MDISNALDSVSWEYLLEMLTQLVAINLILLLQLCLYTKYMATILLQC